MARALQRTVFAVALLLAPCAADVRAGDDDAGNLDRARALLIGGGEAPVRTGAELCLKVGNADAMKLLLDVLEKDQPHYRDIVWEVMARFTDPYARKLVAAKLKGPTTAVRVREWCAQLLGSFGVSDFNGTLAGALTNSDERVRAAAVRSLGRIKDKDVVLRVQNLAHDADPFVRAEVAEAVARIDATAGKPVVWAALRDADAGVRCAVLGAVPAIYPALAEETAVNALADADWRPRMQAVENLCAIKTKTAVDALVRASGDGRPVVAAKAVARLQELSGLKFTLRDQWQKWWSENREKFEFGGGKPPVASADEKSRTVATYNGLVVTSDHVAFVVDKSADMVAPLKGGKSKESAALEALEATLTALPAGVVFDVVTYGAQTQRFAKVPVPLDAKARAAALKFVAGVKCEGRKDIWDVLRTIVSDPTLDTVYLLSSGEPEVGMYVHWNRVTEHLRLLNRHHKVTVHCVSYTDSTWYRSQLENIAKATGGQFTARE